MKSLFIIGLLFLLIGCKSTRIVARVGNQTISAAEFEKSFLDDKSFSQAKLMPLKQRLDHLNEMIDQRVILLEAFRQNIHKDSSLLSTIKDFEKRLVFQQVINKEIIATVVSPKDVKREYNRTLREAKIKHIFLSTNNNVTKTEKQNLKNSLIELRRKAATGFAFSELARKFSKDSLSAGKGGDLGFVKWGVRDFGDNFYKSVFSLSENEISPPIESAKGIHLVLVEKFRFANVPSFEDQKDNIKRKLINLKKEQLKTVSSTFIAKLKQHYNVFYNEENIKFLLDKKEREQKEQIKSNRNTLYLKNFSTDEKDLPLVEYAEDSYKIGRFIEEYNKIPPFRRPPVDDVEGVKDFIERIIPNDLAILWGYEKELEKNKTVVQEVMAKKEELMAYKLRQSKNNEKIEFSDNELKEYYKSSQNKYLEPTRYKVREILVEDFSTAANIVKQANATNFESLATKYNIRQESMGNAGLIGYITDKQFGEIGTVASTMKIGEISGPIKNGKMYSVINLLDVQDEYLPLYENIKPKIKSDLEMEVKKDKINSWQKSLRKNTTIAIYDAHLKNAFN